MARHFGDVEGVPPGATFDSRADVHAAGVHRPTQAGISGSQSQGADSIVVSGGYPDDEDHGDVIIYTGEGGQDPVTRAHVADQTLTGRNLALAKSCDTGYPVRVVRGHKGDPRFSPRLGYRYDGLYRVASYWMAPGKSGFQVIRFRLERLEQESGPWHSTAQEHPPSGRTHPARRSSTVARVVRSTDASRWVKTIHRNHCQVCDFAVPVLSGTYAEAAHIQPLGRPHCGPDETSNMLCLCPNHHVMFDRGGFTVTDDFGLDGQPGRLRLDRRHVVDLKHIRYHRALFR